MNLLLPPKRSLKTFVYVHNFVEEDFVLTANLLMLFMVGVPPTQKFASEGLRCDMHCPILMNDSRYHNFQDITILPPSSEKVCFNFLKREIMSTTCNAKS